MDIPLDDIIRFLTPLLPSLLRLGEKTLDEVATTAGRHIARDAWDKLRSLWAKVYSRESLRQAAQDLASDPKDPNALAAFRLQLRQALVEDPTLAKELAQLLAQFGDASKRRIRLEIVLPSPPERPRPWHNLPQPDYVRFVGRERELAWLRQRLSPTDRAWVLLLTGIGGVGKTALALAIAHEYRERYPNLPPEERFDAIIWASAKEQVLTPTGAEPAGPPGLISHTLAEVYQAIAQVLDREAITRAAPLDQDREVQKALTAQRTLLVLDNLDTMDDAVRGFLRNLPAPTKAIVTSRERRLDVADVLTVRGMEQEEALALIEAEAEPRGLAMSPEQKVRLYERTAGLPLAIRLSVARLGSGETFEGVMRWLGNATGDLTQYCVGEQVKLARQWADAYRLLLACSLFDRDAGASREALGVIADLSIADRDEGLALLERLNLVNRGADDRFRMMPLVQEYVQALLEREAFGPELIERWLNWALEFARNWAANLHLQIKKLPVVAAEYPNLRRALRWCEEHQRWELFVSLVDNIWFYPSFTGLLDETQWMLTTATEAARSAGDERTVGRLLRRLGSLVWDRGEKSKGIEMLRQAISIARRYQDLRELALALDRLASLLDDPEETRSLDSEALAIGEKIGDLEIKVLAAYRLSTMESALGNLEGALEWLDRGEVWARELGWDRALAWFAYRRGKNLIENGRPAEAEPWLWQAMGMMEEPGLIAYSKTELARAYLALGRREEARRIAREALDLIERMGLHSLREDVEKVLRELSGGET